MELPSCNHSIAAPFFVKLTYLNHINTSENISIILDLLKPTWWLNPRDPPQGVVVGHPAPVLHLAVAAHHFHPLRVFVNNFPRGCGPLFPQAAHIQLLVFHGQPFGFEGCARVTSGVNTSQIFPIEKL